MKPKNKFAGKVPLIKLGPLESFLGNGIFASDDGSVIHLRNSTEDGESNIELTPHALDSFFRYIEYKRNVKITIGKKDSLNPPESMETK